MFAITCRDNMKSESIFWISVSIDSEMSIFQSADVEFRFHKNELISVLWEKGIWRLCICWWYSETDIFSTTMFAITCRNSYELGFNLKLSGYEVYFTAWFLLVMIKNRVENFTANKFSIESFVILNLAVVHLLVVQRDRHLLANDVRYHLPKCWVEGKS